MLDGELIERIGKKRPHSRTFSLVMRWLVGLFGWDYIHAETPIDVAAQDNDINQPEPDLIVLARHMDVFRSAHPGPTDIRLVVEISDSTLAQDRTIKARLYARGGIAEYWIVDVDGRRVIVHRNPVPDRGEYSSITAYGENEAVATLAAPASPICVTELLVGLE